MPKGPSRESIDAYIESFSPEIQAVLQQYRSIIQQLFPEAKEVISYNIPAFAIEGTPVVYFSAYSKHTSLSFYPTEETYKTFSQELTRYKHSKSAIQFPLQEPLPEQLIRNIVIHAVPLQNCDEEENN